MKKVIFILITFILSFLVFNSNVSALNSDATATCVYNFPSTAYYKSATIKYSGGKIASKNCDRKTSLDGVSYICTIDVLAAYFENDETDKVYCPTLYYYSDYNIWTSIYSYMIMDDYSITNNLSAKKIKEAKKIAPASSSVVSQGTNVITEDEEDEYLQCQCGSYILITKGEVIFSGEGLNTKEKRYENFNVNSFKTCPETIYYKSPMIANYVIISANNFDGATAIACADTDEIKKYYGASSKNPTDYVEKEDVIKPFCEETAKIWKIIGYLVGALKIMVPVIIIVMGSIDLGKAVVAQSEDDIKKGTQLLIKRVIAGIIIFFIPTIVMIVLKMASKYSSTISSNSTCIECVSKPGSC